MSTSLQSNRLVIGGKAIDVSSFDHPGGNVIGYFHGLDATVAFESFHGHSKRAKRVLSSLPVLEETIDSPKEKRNAEEQDEMNRLLDKWRREGLFQPRLWSTFVYGAVVVVSLFASIIHSARYPISSGVVMGVTWAHCGFLQHMGGHHELGSWSLLVQNLFEGVLKGGSASWWRNRHNKHHSKTNVIGQDGDLRTTPFFAWDSTLAKRLPEFALRTQAFTFLPSLAAYVFLFSFTIRKYAIVKRLWGEVLLMVFHYMLFTSAFYLSGCSIQSGLVCYSIAYAVQGVYLGLFFSLSHFAADRLPPDATWMESSFKGTLDWSGSSFLAGYVSGFLNLQIEHHLVPQMPMENLRLIRGDCREAALKMGLPYREVTFVEAVRLMLYGLWKTGKEELEARTKKED